MRALSVILREALNAAVIDARDQEPNHLHIKNQIIEYFFMAASTSNICCLHKEGTNNSSTSACTRPQVLAPELQEAWTPLAVRKSVQFFSCCKSKKKIFRNSRNDFPNDAHFFWGAAHLVGALRVRLQSEGDIVQYSHEGTEITFIQKFRTKFISGPSKCLE